jgi:CBS domain-containing protein
MATVSDIMTRGVRALAPTDSVRRAAQSMDELNVGSVPVCDGKKLVGMVTDRDITLRCVATGLDIEKTTLSDIMSKDVLWCFEDQPLSEVMVKMAESQVRRLPVVDRAFFRSVTSPPKPTRQRSLRCCRKSPSLRIRDDQLTAFGWRYRRWTAV